jgi:hypothetical protein
MLGNIGSVGFTWLMRGMSLLGAKTTGLGSDDDDVFLLGLATPMLGCGVGALVRWVLLRRFG